MSTDIKISPGADAQNETTTTYEHKEGSNIQAESQNLSDGEIFGEDVAYGPNGVRGLLGNSYVFGAAFLASLGGFSFGYDQGVISIIN